MIAHKLRLIPKMRGTMKENQNHTTGIKSEQLLDQIASAQIRLYDKLIPRLKIVKHLRVQPAVPGGQNFQR
jgi:hypothetical protein